MDDLIHLVNGWSDQQFMKEFGSLFEESAWIAERAAGLRPFCSWEEMMQVMTKQVLDSEYKEKLKLLRKHPDLGARIRMSTSSVQEQAGAGLDSLTPEQYNELKQLNERYTKQFGFPFILAVKGHTKGSIFDSIRQRLERNEQEEFVTALNEVFKIATIRLQQWMTERAK